MNAAAVVGPQFGGDTSKRRIALKKRSDDNNNHTRSPANCHHSSIEFPPKPLTLPSLVAFVVRWRLATILADATVAICGEGDEFTGNMLIDDEYMRSKGLSAAQFLQYRVDPETSP